MALTKRLRFEILRRDNHACRYCGACAPDVKITVDHVIPVALGGTDEPGNLVAACADCNAGKASVPADAPLVADVAADAMRWARAMAKAGEILGADRAKRDALRSDFMAAWTTWGWTDTAGGEHREPLSNDWEGTVDSLAAAGLDLADLQESIAVAMRARNAKDVFRYFCGVAWNTVARKQAIARSIVETEET